MTIRRTLNFAIAGLCLALAAASPSPVMAQSNDALVQMIVKLLADKDKELRAVGLDQVRTEAKGAAATRQFARGVAEAGSPRTVRSSRCALSDRGDAAVLPAVLELLAASHDESVRSAAVATVGSFRRSGPVARLG